ncbi:BA75_03211T0 [Komagataella pastoris]|uniref:BA75_03211T0 n=1 Tax=Komagataella pastoris TaxID=4922 RepID=A0A1B2JDH1_PICPA|nr:BA75_03211T0 [Komagataella pastoris]
MSEESPIAARNAARSSRKIDNYTSLNFVAFLSACFVNIAFAVFLTSTQTYFITDVLGIGQNVGAYVGSLGFFDELLAIIVVPFIGALCDRIGSRPIEFGGLLIVGASFMGYAVFVNETVYPGMLFWRLVFSVGSASIMSIITVMLIELNNSDFKVSEFFSQNFFGKSIQLDAENQSTLDDTLSQAAESLEASGETQAFTGSDDDIIDEGELNDVQQVNQVNKSKGGEGKRVSLVGIASGLGAIFSVSVFLRMPVWFGTRNPAGVALKKSYLVVGVVAILVAILLFFSLYKDDKKKIFKDDIDELFDDLNIHDADSDLDDDVEEAELFLGTSHSSHKSYLESIKYGFQLSVQNPMILLAFLGGFMARCLTITITVFIPFYINHYFYKSGKCSTENTDKVHCPDSYILASILTGISNMAALIFAPIFGVLIDKFNNHAHLLLIVNTLSLLSTVGITFIKTPDSSALIFLFATMLGASQIGFIIISMTMLSNISSNQEYYKNKGSLVGVYSLFGCVGVLIVNKFGGWFGDWFMHGPFILLAVFNVLFFIALFALKGVKKNESRDFQSVLQSFTGTRVGRMFSNNRHVPNSDEF